MTACAWMSGTDEKIRTVMTGVSRQRAFSPGSDVTLKIVW